MQIKLVVVVVVVVYVAVANMGLDDSRAQLFPELGSQEDFPMWAVILNFHRLH